MTDIRVNYSIHSGFEGVACEGLCHRKTLPYLSLVQALDGEYEIQLNDGDIHRTGTGGFFIAPAFVRQTIVHHVGQQSGTMTARWLFLDVVLNRKEHLENRYVFPTVLTPQEAPELCEVVDRYFSAGDDFEATCCLYDIVRLLVRSGKPIGEPQNEFERTVTAYLSEHYAEKLGVPELAKAVCMSESNFYAVFKKHFGLSPTVYLNQYRITLASKMTSETELPICRIAEAVGIPDATYFNRRFRKSIGTTPTEYRRLFHGK